MPEFLCAFALKGTIDRMSRQTSHAVGASNTVSSDSPFDLNGLSSALCSCLTLKVGGGPIRLGDNA